AVVASEQRITSGNAVLFAKTAFTAEDDAEVALQQLKDVLSEGRSVLLSSEFFAEWRRDRVAKLHELASRSGFQTKVIVYLREQSEYIVTAYFQDLKRRPGVVDKDGAGFRQFVERCAAQHFLDFDALLQMWASVVGRENMTVRARRTNDLMRDFLRAIDISNDEGFDFNVPDINVTPRPQEMKIRALLGVFEPTLRTSDVYLNVLSRLYATTGKRSVDDCNFMIDPDIVQEIRLKFQSSNERMCQQWFPGLQPSEVLERRNFPAPTSFSSDTVDLESVIAVLGGISIDALNRIEALERQVKALRQAEGRGSKPAVAESEKPKTLNRPLMRR
ncbi:MAG TPA: hypothetical protein VFK79_10240, partial [Xanthobacteraceae bacterium]|nr:hypothetical protein [Xanthobacteraceae bacterium]